MGRAVQPAGPDTPRDADLLVDQVVGRPRDAGRDSAGEVAGRPGVPAGLAPAAVRREHGRGRDRLRNGRLAPGLLGLPGVGRPRRGRRSASRDPPALVRRMDVKTILERPERRQSNGDGSCRLLPNLASGILWAARAGLWTRLMSVRLEIPRERLAALCSRRHIRRLSFFGSILRDDFGPDSDVDVLVEFEPGHTPGWEIVDIAEELSTVFGGRRVDLVNPRYLNHRLRDRVLRSAVVEFESPNVA
jgi:predicted nucleotidyltransferase